MMRSKEQAYLEGVSSVSAFTDTGKGFADSLQPHKTRFVLLLKERWDGGKGTTAYGRYNIRDIRNDKRTKKPR